MTDATPHDDQAPLDRIRDGLHSARDAAEKAYDATHDKAADAARRTAEGFDGNPLGILVGGLALGAIAGALIPRSGRERSALAPLGAKLGAAFVAAKGAAIETGQARLAEFGISKDAARGQAKSLFDNLVQAATAAGTAGVKAAAGKADQATAE